MPAVDSATRSTLSALLKNVYQPEIRDNVANPSAFWAEIQRKSDKIVEGSKIIDGVRLGLSQAVGARSELGTLPAAQRTPLVNAETNLKYIYGVIRISGPLMAASKTEKAAFKRALEHEVKGIKDSLRLDMARMVYGDGTGAIANTGVTTASLTVQLATTANMRLFHVGMMIDIYNSSNAKITDGDSREIESIDETNKTITLVTGNVVTTAAAGYVVREDTYNQEITGLQAIVKATGALQALNPATAGQERWKSTVDTAFGAFDETKFQDTFDAIHSASGKWVNRIFSDSAPRNKFVASLQAQRRFVGQPPSLDLKAGFKGLSYTGGEREAAWVKDALTPDNKQTYLINMDEIELQRAFDFQFMELDGNAWMPEFMGSSGVDAWKAVLHSYCQLWTGHRAAHGRVDIG